MNEIMDHAGKIGLIVAVLLIGVFWLWDQVGPFVRIPFDLVMWILGKRKDRKDKESDADLQKLQDEEARR